jgi:hypothetical protein
MRLSYGRFVFACIAGGLAFSTWAQLRAIPPDTKRGELTHLRENVVQLDDKQVRLAPGALIRDTNNIIVLPTMVPTRAVVRYQIDNQGMLSRAWILSPQEAAQDKPTMKPMPTPIKPDADKSQDSNSNK